MKESVYIPLLVTQVEEAAEPPSKTYRLDLEEGRILGMVDGQEAVRQAIHKAIITPRWKCLIYDNQYGSEIEAAVIQSQGRTATISRRSSPDSSGTRYARTAALRLSTISFSPLLQRKRRRDSRPSMTSWGTRATAFLSPLTRTPFMAQCR